MKQSDVSFIDTFKSRQFRGIRSTHDSTVDSTTVLNIVFVI